MMPPLRVIQLFLITLLACSLGLVVGCSNDDPTFQVKGKVTQNNEPMTEGTISFEAEPPDGKPAASASIKDGEYVLKATPGKKLVRISLQKEVETDMGGEMLMVPTELIPAKYNSESTETVEVTQVGPNEFNFEVKSKE